MSRMRVHAVPDLQEKQLQPLAQSVAQPELFEQQAML